MDEMSPVQHKSSDVVYQVLFLAGMNIVYDIIGAGLIFE